MLDNIDNIKMGGIVTIRDELIKKQVNGEKVLRLESGDPSFDIPRHVEEAINKALVDGKTHYTAGAGIPELREAIAEKLKKKNKIYYAKPTNVFVTNGAMHGLYIAFRALCDKNSEIIVPNPTWTETVDNISLAGGVPVKVDLDIELKYRADRIEKAITKNTVAIVINSPHNPTGTVLTKKELLDIVIVAAKHNLYVISDEAYEDIIFDGLEHFSPGGIYDKSISIYSFSKSYAMSGLRLGYLAVNDDKIKTRISKLLRCTINGVNSATQYGGVAALSAKQDDVKAMCQIYEERRNMLLNALYKCSLFDVAKPHGAFYFWCKIKGWNGDDWGMSKMLAEKYGIGSAPGSVFGNKNNYLRFAFSCGTSQIKEAAEILGNI